MGVVIFVAGELGTPSLTDCQKDYINSIQNGYDVRSFEAWSNDERGSVEFKTDCIDGNEPYSDGVLKPLEKLIEYCKAEGILLNGCFEVSSYWSNYDNILIDVTDSEVAYKNKEIVNASTKELVDELISRHALSREKADEILANEEKYQKELAEKWKKLLSA